MPKSVFEAIESGTWNFEPATITAEEFSPTQALPGSEDKLLVLRDRLIAGLPLWHPRDRKFVMEVPETEA